MLPHPQSRLIRRRFLASTVLASGALVTPRLARRAAAQGADRSRPAVPFGVQAGDVTRGSAVVWSATDRPVRMLVAAAPPG
jgi:alkaline phosphatase D